MELTQLGTSTIKVSKVCLGTWAIGGWMWGGTEERDAIATILAALERGINFIDTAPVYGFGRSEELVGKAIKQSGRRQDVVLATKVGLAWDSDEAVSRDSRRARIFKEIDDSLRRLQTDYIDLYQVHWPDPLVPIAETADAMAELLRMGKIRAIGVSNYSSAQMNDFSKVAPLHAIQPPYNLFERDADADILPYAANNGLAVLAYGALCRGLLSGRMTPHTAFQGDDLRRNDPKFQQPRFGQYLRAVQKLGDFAHTTHQQAVLPLAIRWVLERGAIALWGARNPSQLDAVSAVNGWRLSGTQMDEIDRIVRACVQDPIGPEFMAPPARH